MVHARQSAQNCRDLTAGGVKAAASVENEMRPAAFFGIGHLFREDCLESLRRHSGPRQHTGALRFGRSRHDHHGVHGAIAARFEQERDVENAQSRAARCASGEKSVSRRAHQRMNDALQPP